MNPTKPELVAAFTEWQRRYRDEPERFLASSSSPRSRAQPTGSWRLSLCSASLPINARQPTPRGDVDASRAVCYGHQWKPLGHDGRRRLFKEASPAVFFYSTINMPLQVKLREGDGLRAGPATMMVAGFGVGYVVVESTTAGRVECKIGDVIPLGDAIATLHRLTVDGRRKVQFDVSAPWHVPLKVLRRQAP